MSVQAQEIEGWYPDPWGSAELRWWDGGSWSTKVRSPSRSEAVQHDVRTGTVSIWLFVLLPLAWFALGFVEPASANPAAMADPSSSLAGMLLYLLVLIAIPVAMVVFAAVDYRALQDRGIERPFGWGWSFFILLLIVGGGVYVIGRTVVLRRETGGGLAPLWGWILVTIISTVVLVLAVVGFLIALQEGLEIPVDPTAPVPA